MPHDLLTSQRISQAIHHRDAIKESIDDTWWPSAQIYEEENSEQAEFWWGTTSSAPFEQPLAILQCTLKTDVLVPGRTPPQYLDLASPTSSSRDSSSIKSEEDGDVWRQFGSPPHASVSGNAFALLRTYIFHFNFFVCVDGTVCPGNDHNARFDLNSTPRC